MATESPMRMVESDQARNWPASKDSVAFSTPLKDMAVDELGFLLKRHGLHENETDRMPSRSGSAPPSMEGSFAAIKNLLSQQDPESSSEILSRAIEKYDSEEQIRGDPAYFAYYFSNINLNPRLPPPLISPENRHLLRHFAGFSDSRRSTSWDNIGNKSVIFSQGGLSPHKEEPEDETLAEQSLEGWADRGTAASLTGRHKSLVDLIQEDFPRTPSPVYNQSHSSSSHQTAEENVLPSNISPEKIAKLPESDLASVDICVDTHSISLISDVDPFTSASSVDGTRGSSYSQKDDTNVKDTRRKDVQSVNGTSQSDISRMNSRARKIQEDHQSYGRKMPLQFASLQQAIPYPTQGVQSHRIGGSHGEVQPPLHNTGLAPPLYTSTAAYMNSANPFYPNFQPSNMYAPQYGFGSYAMGSSLLPPYVAGYPSHGISMPFDVSSGSGFNARTAGVSAGQSIFPGGDLQQQKFYGQQALMLQPPYMDPLQMQYFQNPFGDAYGVSFPYPQMASGGTGVQADSFGHKEPNVGCLANPRLQAQTTGGVNLQSPRKVGPGAGSFYAAPSNMSVMTQFPGSPLASPLLPSSPVGGMSNFGRQNEMRFAQSSSRHSGFYSGWQGQRGVNSVDDLKRPSFLEELKSTSARKFELSDIAGRIVEFSVDQHGSRFIQQKLEHCSDEEKLSVFKEVLPHASKLMTDVFGNYVIQKFLEHGNPEQRKELANQLVSQMLPLSLQMYGCRVIQKALEVIELDQKTELVHELDGHVMRCVRDQNGNHVIQKCIECIPTERIAFIISAFRGQVAMLSTHPYGCRVIQRILEHCSDELQTRLIIDEILESAFDLAHDQYGNYVTQHVLERGKHHERSQIISKLAGHIVQMSQHKYASNVVEKCLEYADGAEREILVEEIIGKSDENDHLLPMMKDQFANYVVQKVLEISTDRQREVLLERVRGHLHALRKYTYGKHIVARFEQLFSEGSQASEDGA